MSVKVKTGWLKNNNGEYFAPKTLASQVQTNDGTLLEEKIQADLDVIKKDIIDEVSIIDDALSSTSDNPVQNKVIDAEFKAISDIISDLESAINGKADAHDHPYLSNTTTYAGSDSIGGAANSANKVNITRPSNVLSAAAAMSIHTEQIFFLGSDGLSAGAPVNYCIINAKRGTGERTILDCYDLQTGDHYINGNMTVTNTDTWTGWVLQPNQAAIDEALAKSDEVLTEAKAYTDTHIGDATHLADGDREILDSELVTVDIINDVILHSVLVTGSINAEYVVEHGNEIQFTISNPSNTITLVVKSIYIGGQPVDSIYNYIDGDNTYEISFTFPSVTNDIEIVINNGIAEPI